jgi:hypothetical protein
LVWCSDDIEVTKALLRKSLRTWQKKQSDHAEGPMGFSNLDKVGVMTEGFEMKLAPWSPGFILITNHFRELGFKVEKNI